MFNASSPLTDHSHMVLDAATSHMLPGSFIQSGIPDGISFRQTMPCGPLFSTLQEETLDNQCIANDDAMISGEVSICRIMPHVGNISLSDSNGNTTFPEHFMGTSIPSFTNLLSAATNLHESLISSSIAPTSVLPSEEFRTSRSNDSCTTLNSSISAPVHCDFGLQTSKTDANSNAHLNYRWNYDEVPGHQIHSARMTSTVRPSYHIVGSLGTRGFPNKSTLNFDPPDSYFASSNEPSLSLSSSQPLVLNLSNVPDQRSEVCCSGITPDARGLQDHSHGMGHSLHSVRLENRPELGCNLANSEELPLYCDSSSGFCFPRVILESKFIHATQEIFSEIASYALEDLDEIDDPLGGTEGEVKMSTPSNCVNESGISVIGCDKFPLSSGESKFQGHRDPLLQQDTDIRKSELSMMLQKVCEHEGW